MAKCGRQTRVLLPGSRSAFSSKHLRYFHSGATGRARRRGEGLRERSFFLLRKLRDMHPGLLKGFPARRAPGQCGRLSEPQGGAWATCWDQIGEAPAGNGGEVRFPLDSHGEVHDRKRLAQQAFACCLPLPPTAFFLGGAIKFSRPIILSGQE